MVMRLTGKRRANAEAVDQKRRSREEQLRQRAEAAEAQLQTTQREQIAVRMPVNGNLPIQEMSLDVLNQIQGQKDQEIAELRVKSDMVTSVQHAAAMTLGISYLVCHRRPHVLMKCHRSFRLQRLN